jgi:AcrR family transcriptional regulator
MGAALSVAETDGTRSLTVARVLARSRVTRKIFYELFADGEDCLGAALQEVFEGVGEVLGAAFRSGDGWRPGMRAAVQALLSLADEHRDLARVCIVDMAGGGPRLLALRAQAMRTAQEAIGRGEFEQEARSPGPLVAEALVGAIAEMLHKRLFERDPAPLTELGQECMSLIVLPYLGPAAAKGELNLKPPVAKPCEMWEPPRSRDAARAQVGRMTYRTARVLMAVGERPGASNREIGDYAGIADQGQTSKLLKRLATRDLIENFAHGNVGNAWRLTDLGTEVVTSTRVR